MPFRTVKFPCGTLRLGSGSWAQPGLAFQGLPDRLDLRGRWAIPEVTVDQSLFSNRLESRLEP